MNTLIARMLLIGAAAACFLLSQHVLAEDYAAEAKKMVASCMRENGVTAQDVEDFKAGKTKPEDVKDNMKCATQCLLVKLGFMDSAGQLKMDEISKRFADTPMKADVEKAAHACRTVKGENPCDTAFEMITCLKNSKLDLDGA